MVLVVLWSVCPVRRAAVLLPMALTLGLRWYPCPPPQGETCATFRSVGPRRRQPITPNTTKGGARWVMGYMWTCPPSHAITRRGTRCQPKERAPQLTPTDPSQTVRPRRSGAPAEPERNHTASSRGAELDAAAKTAEQGNIGRPADTSGDYDDYEEANASGPHGPSSRTDQEAEHSSGDPFSIKLFKSCGLVCRC